jgi:hypothetical protein
VSKKQWNTTWCCYGLFKFNCWYSEMSHS